MDCFPLGGWEVTAREEGVGEGVKPPRSWVDPMSTVSDKGSPGLLCGGV